MTGGDLLDASDRLVHPDRYPARPDEVARRRSPSLGEAGYARRPLDAYFTEPWVTRALIEAVEFGRPGEPRSAALVWEPACGDGRMARPLAHAGYTVIATDLAADRGYGQGGVDFLDPGFGHSALAPAAIVTNPPFDLAVPFILRALQFTRAQGGKVAMLQRHEFDAPASHHPLFVAPFAAKLILHKRPRWSDEPETASPRFPYAWYLWDWRHQGAPILRYLPDPDAPAKAVGALL